MNKFIFAFLLGAVAGSAITWKLIKTKYEHIAQEEIDSVKEVFSRREKDISASNKKVEEEANKTPLCDEKPDLFEYAKKLNNEGYTNYSTNSKEGGMDVGKPYVISPEEFGQADGYEAESLTYYADGVLADDWDNRIENVEDMVGVESLTHFGEYEDDSVFVRNDRFKIDYEILRDNRNFSDVAHSDNE